MKKDTHTDGYLHILKYISLFGGVQGLNVLIGVVRNKFVAILLGPQGVGLISLFNSTTKLIGDSTNFGLPMSAVRNISEDLLVDGGYRPCPFVEPAHSPAGSAGLHRVQPSAQQIHLLLGWAYAAFHLSFSLCVTGCFERRRACHPQGGTPSSFAGLRLSV